MYSTPCTRLHPLTYNFCFCAYVIFFFSSRRRHTRLQGDWSSDVCSSDLAVVERQVAVLPDLERAQAFLEAEDLRRVDRRSEERRVGKECRAVRAPSHKKMKEESTTNRRRQKTEQSKSRRDGVRQQQL